MWIVPWNPFLMTKLLKSKICEFVNSAHRVLFMEPQISLFSNFFIKNGSHGTIHIFINYFITVFFSYQFSVFSCIQTDPRYHKIICALHCQLYGLLLKTIPPHRRTPHVFLFFSTPFLFLFPADSSSLASIPLYWL